MAAVALRIWGLALWNVGRGSFLRCPGSFGFVRWGGASPRRGGDSTGWCWG
ncbi:hypothetical protein ACFSHQ_09510 [Gemmobacter lanyuensis]